MRLIVITFVLSLSACASNSPIVSKSSDNSRWSCISTASGEWDCRDKQGKKPDVEVKKTKTIASTNKQQKAVTTRNDSVKPAVERIEPVPKKAPKKAPKKVQKQARKPVKEKVKKTIEPAPVVSKKPQPQKTVSIENFGSNPDDWFIQIGPFVDKQESLKLMVDLTANGFSPTQVQQEDGAWIYLGPYYSEASAEKFGRAIVGHFK